MITFNIVKYHITQLLLRSFGRFILRLYVFQVDVVVQAVLEKGILSKELGPNCYLLYTSEKKSHQIA